MFRFLFGSFVQVICIVSLVACGSQPEVEVGYQPPIAIPVRVSINAHGQIKVGFSGAIVTPIGTFDIGAGFSVNSVRQQYTNKILVVRVDAEAIAYELEEGKEFRVNFDDSNTLYKKVALEYASNGDIVLELESVKDTVSSDPVESNPPSNNYRCDDLTYVKLGVGDKVKIVWPKVNLRSEPIVPNDFYANIVAELEEGTSLTIIGGPECAHNGTWWEVKTQNGQSGWMREHISDGYLIKH